MNQNPTTDRSMLGRGSIYTKRKPITGTGPRYKEVFNHFKQETVKFPVSSKVIAFSDIAALTAKAEKNRRKLEHVNLEKLDLYRLLKQERVITEPALGYTLGDDPTIYLINGWTRRSIILELHTREDITIDLPVDVMRLTEDDLWLVPILVQQSNTNTQHNPFEKSDMFMDFYEIYAEENPDHSTRALYHSIGNSTVKSPSYSRFKSMLFYSALVKILEKQEENVLPKIRSMSDVNSIMKWLSSEGTDISISEDNKCIQNLSDHIIAQIMPHLDDIVLLLSESENCGEAFKISSKKPLSGGPIEIDSKNCSINYSISRSDVSPEAMEKIVSLFKQKEAELADFMKKIDSIVEEDLKISKTN